MNRRLDELTRDEAIRLLATASIGRVGITVGALPAILPVNYAVMDDAIVFRSAPGAKLSAAMEGVVVAFETDESDVRSSTAWSVLVIGYAREITDRARLDRARSLDLQSWVPGFGDRFVEIPLELVTGRRITAPVGDLHRQQGGRTPRL
jgi:nitroimidazol reductase NimA-like FMN-containing flavoprotein (pyridoxamine 5'-phosphate oxidase superfamily)